MKDFTQSYASGTTGVPLIGATIGSQFDAAVARWGSRDALVVRQQNVHWSWLDLKDRVDKFAAGLIHLGLTPGSRIGIWAPNCAEWTITQFAAAKAGLILVNINPAYRAAELEYALNKVGCLALVTAAAFKTSDYLGIIQELAPEIDTSARGMLEAARLPHLRHVIRIGGEETPGTNPFEEILERGRAAGQETVEALAPKLKSDDPINIQFTSGTTGFPKGATLTHHNILNNGYFVGAAQALDEIDRICIPVPLYHCFGMVMGNLAAVTHGAAMVYPSEAFDPLTTLETVEAEKCTALYGVPTMFIAELQHSDFPEFDLSSLRTGIMAGSPCPIEVMKQVNERMHMKDITIAYGMTETSPVSTQTSIDDPLDRRVSTVGRVQPHLEVKIIDADGHIVPVGKKGELCTRGYSVMSGYWEDADRTAAAIDTDGWMHTGDLATMDEAGFLNIVGRIKDMVIRGGENLYPREIEEFLYSHSKIAEVQIFGVPDDKFGEELCAWIMLAEGVGAHEVDIRSFCDGQIAHQKVPRYIRFVDAFPMTVTGKIQKYIMRDRMIEELGLNVVKTA
ncbi:MAG: AMP-binding protein [Pseudomonadota bacterium]|nr:AMP-binding protein [Pseudomonadota bacterium]